MRILELCTSVFMIAGAALLAVSQDDSWKKGPGELHLAEIATVPAPEGYEYIETPFAKEKLLLASKAPVGKNQTLLGAVRDPKHDWKLSFLYIPVGRPILTEAMSRLYAGTRFYTAADRTVNSLNGLVGSTARVVENDSYDPRQASVTFVVSTEQAGLADTKLSVLTRSVIYFGRRGLLIAGFEAQYSDFSAADSTFRKILEGVALLPPERFYGIFEIFGPAPPGGAHLRWYALAGLLTGAAIASIRRRTGKAETLHA